MATLEEVKFIWQSADAVCFDVDSTVCQDEGMDELAKFCGKGEDVVKLTTAAMRGGLEFRESLRRRLELIHPRLEQVRDFVRSKPPKLTPHIKELVQELHRRSVPVYLISGGFRGIIGPVALMLNVPLENIFANRLKFFFSGEYAGFDEEEPTSRSNGKGEVIKVLKKKFGYGQVVMIGDGMTDMEACPPGDAFIGFGGNVVRKEVQEKALWYVTDFRELVEALHSP